MLGMPIDICLNNQPREHGSCCWFSYMMRLPVAAADHGMCGKCQSRIAPQVKRAVSGKAGLEQFWDGTLHHRSDLPYAEDLHDLQDVFTPFRNKASTCLAEVISPASLATMLDAISSSSSSRLEPFQCVLP